VNITKVLEPLGKSKLKTMKKLILILAFLSISCKTVEERINDNSYTTEWHYENGQRFQVYQTDSHRKYIIVLNRNETKFIRKYIKQ
jgi:hypothetical protein